jgi:hypothetical protein
MLRLGFDQINMSKVDGWKTYATKPVESAN